MPIRGGVKARRSYPEHTAQVAVAEFLTVALPEDAAWTAIDLADARDARTGAMKKARGCKPGVPDLLIVWRRQLYCIEMKSLDGRLSEAQRERRAELLAAGALYAVARTSDQVERQLRAWGIPLRANHLALVGGTLASARACRRSAQVARAGA